MKILMLPHPTEGLGNESGIKRVVEAYHRHLPAFGVELVNPDAKDYDLKVVHAGMTGGDCDIAMIHGLYWTADYPAPDWEYRVNARVIEAIRSARAVTVPSDWVAETFRRDMRFNPYVIPHGIDWQDWQHKEENGGYILWNKNRVGDVCDNSILAPLAEKFPAQQFVSTFAPRQRPRNLRPLGDGLIPHAEMKKVIQQAGVYLSTTKETFGIGVLEAMASGVPVLGWAYGGNVQLVQHGVSGYLAEPGNLEELYEGLAYCLKYRETLGANGRELARRWTWGGACEKLVEVYRQAMEPEPATVSVVIPVYNKTIEQVRRAVESAYHQTFKPEAIIIVDDGSTNGIYNDLCQLRTIDENTINVFRTDNQGVANARNNGIAITTTKYICCLDSDDWIGPNFLENCIRELEQFRDVGITYSALMAHNSDGSVSLSLWPTSFNPDAQLTYTRKQNQVSTCCVFRREAWQRVGGYKSKYHPIGAGSEDAAFWSAICSIGYNAKLINETATIKAVQSEVVQMLKAKNIERSPTIDEIKARVSDKVWSEFESCVFNYTAHGGFVYKNKNYGEMDWLSMYPWAKDKQHPFASVATPARHSHPVRQYDQPEISVIIPVGPGHEQVVQDALDSLEMQHFRKWEAIVVYDVEDKASPYGWIDRLAVSYPYIRSGNTGGGKGAGAARNLGATLAHAPFLFFLDADDVLNQPDALDKLLAGWKQEEAIIYSDYLGKSTWPLDKAQKEFGPRLLGYLEKRGQAIVRYYASDYDYDRAIKEPKFNKDNPAMPYYLWCTVSVLIPRAWHQAIGGFDETMTTWEDADYFWRLARAGYCFRRVAEPLLLYDYDTGHRREAGNPRDDDGRQKHQIMIQYITRKYENEPIQMCNCRGRRNGGVTTPEAIVTGKVQTVYGVQDEDLIMIEFTPHYAGNRQLVGASTHINYGYSRRAGDRFLVHKADVEAQPHLFKPVQMQPVAPRVELPPTPPPEPVVQKVVTKPLAEPAKLPKGGKRRRSTLA